MNTITLWYDHPEKNNCQFNDTVYSSRTIIERLADNDLKFIIKYTNADEVKHDDINVYVIEVANVHNEFDFISLIPEHTKQLLCTDLSLLLYYPKEGHTLDQWLFRIYQQIKNNGLLASKIFLLFGDNDFEKNYYDWADSCSVTEFCVPISIDFFKGEYFDRSLEFNDSFNEERPYDFICYNGKMRPHRLLTVAEFKHRNILDRGIVSLVGISYAGELYNINQCVTVLKQFNCYFDYVKEFVKDFQPIVQDLKPDEFNRSVVFENNKEHYSSSYFSVVSETSLTTRFITEKTYKPIANCHPFIIIGSANLLTLLRQHGYQTFPELFDESYDTETDHIKRLYMVIDQIEKFVKLSESQKKEKFHLIKEKLVYNRNHFFDHAQQTKKRDLENIFNKIKTHVS